MNTTLAIPGMESIADAVDALAAAADAAAADAAPAASADSIHDGRRADRAAESPRVVRPDRRQRFWVDACLDERLASDHPARTIWAVVERLDLAPFLETIDARGSQAGRPAIDPRLLLSLWLFATTDGVGNGRKLDRLCREHDAYRWLCGGVNVNYHTLNDFRVQHAAALDGLFTQVLTALVHQGVLRLKRGSLDSLRTRASAGTSSFHRRETLEKTRAEVAAYLQELKRQADETPAQAAEAAARQRAAALRGAKDRQRRLDQALALLPELEAARASTKLPKADRGKPVRVSSTDPEARKIKMADGGVRPGYNVQILTDTESGAVTAVDVCNSSSDHNQSAKMRAQLKARTGRTMKELLMDSGYVDLEQIEQAEQDGVTVYAPLPLDKNRQPVAAARGDTPGVTAWRQRMQTPEAQEIYRERYPASERTNAEFRERLGLRAFAVRGLVKVRCVAVWTALALNIKQFAACLLI